VTNQGGIHLSGEKEVKKRKEKTTTKAVALGASPLVIKTWQA
jgi:hypothetical protein